MSRWFTPEDEALLLEKSERNRIAHIRTKPEIAREWNGNVELVTIKGGAVQAASPPRETAAALAGSPPEHEAATAVIGHGEQPYGVGMAQAGEKPAPSTSNGARAVRNAKRIESVAGGLPSGEAAANGAMGGFKPAGQSGSLTRSKYGNRKTDGYDSIKESKRAAELKLLEAAGEIRNLREQVAFELIPKQNGERACRYVCDFAYERLQGSATWTQVVEDCKGVRTPLYILKRKLMIFIFGIRISEV